ncbi:MAG: hypothetical protein JWN44_6926 [Myxococcales bacterium]|nr:hypothetical protein [Myxococcales bacterium]
MTNRTSGEQLRFAAQRALAFGYAAMDRPTLSRVRDARNLVVKVLTLVDDNLCGGEIGELVKALQHMATELTGIEQRTA